ncbi:MAG: hypothetical protein AAGE52_17090 [Myxococcota bacterium]
MSELSPEAKAILDAARGVDNPTADDRARVRRAVLGAVGGAAVVATAASASASSAASSAAASSVATGSAVGAAAATGVTGLSVVAAKAAVALTLVSASVGIAVTQPWESDAPAVAEAPEVEVAAREVEVPSTAVSTALEPTAPETSEPPVEEASEALQVAQVGAPAARRARPRATVDPEVEVEPAETLSAELGLLRRARSALARGDHQAAESALREHERRFPAGTLVAEREGTLVLARCAQGDPSGVASFLATHPRSPLAARIRDACR